MAQTPLRTLNELILDKSGFDLVKEWAKNAKNNVEFLPAKQVNADSTLYQLQVTTRSPMGAIVYFTGGILIDKGWMRVLGSGSSKLSRNIASWNKGKTFQQFGQQPKLLLVADDVAGGLFAINAGALGTDIGKMYFFAPDALEWEPMDLTYSDFLNFCFNGDLKKFYENLRWNGWEKDMAAINGDQAFSFYPFLWTKEGKDLNKVSKRPVPIEEVYSLNITNQENLKHK